MKKIIKIQKVAFLAVVAAVLTLCSCKEDEIYQKEQYKHVFSIASTEGEYNVFTDVLHLALPESKCYVTASMGGTNPTTEATEVHFTFDKNLFDRHNVANFGTNVTKYANLLPESMYTIDNYTLTIPAGATEGRLLIRIRPEGLCPDSTYLLPLTVTSFSKHEIHPKRNSILYNVRLRNKFVNQGTNYKMTAQIGESPADLVPIILNKPVHPIAKNTIRTIVGMEPWKSPVERSMIEDKTITIAVSEIDSTITVKPYKHLDLEQLYDPEYPNKFRIVRDGLKWYRSLSFYYRYTLDDKTWYVKEELRQEYNPDTLLPEDLL